MKKLLVSLLLGISVIGITSCNNNDDDNTSESTTHEFFRQEIKYEKIVIEGVEDTYTYQLTKNISKNTDFTVANYYKECTVVKVKEKASYNNIHLKKLTLQDKMEYVSDSAFEKCINLENVYLSDDIRFGQDVFKDCTKIKTLDENNLCYLTAKIEDEEDNKYYYLFKTSSLESSYTTNILTRSIMDAFKDNQKVNSIVLNDGLKYINSAAFKNSSLKQINIPSSVTYIGPNAFANVTDLKITLNQNLKGYFTLDGINKEEVTLTSDNIVDYLTNTHVNYFFFKEEN